jgi:hypothetical protein
MSVIARAAAVFAAALACAAPALAGDGVIEIHPACVAAGCGPGDFPGFPVTLASGRSYRLTADLVVPTADDRAIDLLDGATLDLGGFSLSGPVTCSGAPATCSATGQGDGVLVFGSGTIRNGRIAGFGSRGVRVQSNGLRLERVVLAQNGLAGAYLEGRGHQVVDCTALRNGGDGFFLGIVTDQANLVLRSTAYGNAGDGFDLIGSLVLDVAAHANGGLGLRSNYQNHRSAVGRSVFGNNNGSAAATQADIAVEFGANVCGAVSCP